MDFRTDNIERQWGRCSTMWHELSAIAKHQQGTTSIEWSPDGHKVSIHSSYHSGEVDVVQFRSLVSALPALVWLHFLDMFPPSFPESLKASLSDLSIHSFRDSPDDERSLFERSDNVEVFKPFREALCPTALDKDFTFKASYTTKLSPFLTLLAQFIMAGNGISMRSFQAAALQVAPSDGFPRNFFIDDLLCYIGKPRAKQCGLNVYEAYWLLEPRVALAIILYIGIFRPLESSLLENQGDASGSSPFLFVKVAVANAEPTAIRRWEGRDINQALYAEGSPLQAEGRVYRQITKALLRRNSFSTLGSLQELPAYPNAAEQRQMLLIGRKEQLALSQAVHSFFGFKSPPHPMQPVSPAVSSLPHYALDVARHKVRHRYALTGGSVANVKNQVTWLSRTLPFLYGDGYLGEESEWTCLGDQNLVEVSAATIWGGMQPSMLEALPFEGYPRRSIATAMSMVRHHFSVLSLILTSPKIWIAIQEWKDGSYYPENVSERSIAIVTDTFLPKVQTFCKIQPSGWTVFSLAVREYARRPLHFVNPYPQPAIVPNTTLLPFDATITDRTNAKLPTLRRRNLLEIIDDSGRQMPVRPWGRVVHRKPSRATQDFQAEQSEVERPTLTSLSLPVAGTGNQLPSTISVCKAQTPEEPTLLSQKKLPFTDRHHSVLSSLKQQSTHHEEMARGREEPTAVALLSHLADQTKYTVQAVENFAAAMDLLQDDMDTSLQAVCDSTRLVLELGKQRIQLLRTNFELIQGLSDS